MVREGERCFDVVSILVFLRLILLLPEDLHLAFTFVRGTITFWTLALLPPFNFFNLTVIFPFPCLQIERNGVCLRELVCLGCIHEYMFLLWQRGV